jgi:hypothetical protein
LVRAVGAACRAAGYVNKRYTETAYGLPFGVGTFSIEDRPLYPPTTIGFTIYLRPNAFFDIKLVKTPDVLLV